MSLSSMPEEALSYTVRPLSWAGYKALKSLLSEALTGELLPQLAKLLRGPLAELMQIRSQPTTSLDADVVAGMLTGLADNAEALIVTVIAEGGAFADKLESLLVQHCTDLGANDDLPAEQWIRLRDAAFEAADLPSLLAREKNFWSRATGDLLRSVGISLTPSPGTSASSTSSPPATDGLPEPSTN